MNPIRREALFRRLIASAALLALSALLLAAVQQIPAFTQNVYLPFSRAVSSGLGVLFSFTSYAVAEALLIMAVAGGVVCLVRTAVRMARERTAWPLALWASKAVLYATGVAFLFIFLWGGAYYAAKLEARLDLPAPRQDDAILFQTAKRHLEDVIHYAKMVPRDANGEVNAGGFSALAPEAARAMRSLMEKNPGLFGNVPVAPPKRAAFYPVLGMLGISGIYSPFTGEAIVNTINTDPFLPSVMTHELAHRLGVAPEDDANFIAYLACMESDQPIFRYSGSLMAFNYCYGAITDLGDMVKLYSMLYEEAPDTLEDYDRNREEWDEYDGPLRETAEAVNDAYLQTMGQEEGVRSYGRVVDLLIALHMSESGDEN
jgi:hypothetical protein